MTTEHAEGSRRWVWVPCSHNLFKPAYVVKEEELVTLVQSDVLEKVKNGDIFKMNPSKFDGVEDLAYLSHLNEPSVLHNIQLRYESGEIYTYSGLFLLALNPFKATGIYGDQMKREVMLQKQRECSPHIFVIANEAYRSLVTNRENQSILITGESGAGKTENTKRVIEFLSYAARSGGAEYSPEIEAGLSAANPLLEAFGNAKTIKNDNSSRFGKFIQIKFRSGTMCGARIEGYLLEKTRIAGIRTGERNFHILYYFLAGATDEELAAFGLERGVAKYACLRGGEPETNNRDDKEGWQRVQEAFKTLKISPEPYYKILALVLLLSNIELIEENGRCVVENIDLVEQICDFLSVPVTDFLKNLLVPTLRAGHENVLRHRSADEARAVINGLMKTLYEGVFFRLIGEINKRLDSSPNDLYVGILDIAGFEIFAQNSFEQFCINYTNEKLQQYFNHHMFVLEQELYRSEVIEWNFIDFGLDLEPTIRAIESINPIGILAYLDEECAMGWGSDKRLLEKITSAWPASGGLVQRVPFRDGFKMRHYAGVVEYSTDKWVEKNRDVESEPLVCLVTGTTGSGPRGGGVKKGIFRTVAQAHRENLRTLMAALQNTQPHFVRCILPNLERRPGAFDRRLVLGQLRCNGVLEGIRISRLGYPTRLPYADFLSRYSMLVDAKAEEQRRSTVETTTPRNRTKRLVENLMIAENDFRLGKTRIFFRQGVMADLEERREACIREAAVRLQEAVRSVLCLAAFRHAKDQADVVAKLRRNAKLSLALLRWPWWRMLRKITPLLDVKRSDGRLKAAEERVCELSEKLETQSSVLKEREERLVELQRRASELEASVAAAAGALSERDELLAALRAENEARGARVEAAESEIKRQKDVADGLREAAKGAEKQLEDHVSAMARLEASLEAERAAREAAEAEVSASRQRIEELVRANDKVLREHAAGSSLAEQCVRERNEAIAERDKLSEKLTREVRQRECMRRDCIAALGEVKRGISEAGGPWKMLSSCVKECADVVKRRDEESQKALAKCREECKQLCGFVEKLKNELRDAQSECDSLATQKGKLEVRLSEAEGKIKRLQDDLEYKTTVAATLEKHLEERRRSDEMRSEEQNAAAAVSASDEALLKEVQTLRRECAKLNGMYAALSGERNQLHEENVKLTKSKLDDLFQCEAEFAAAKSALRTEVRRLEAENERLRRGLEAQQSGSECSEDFVALLEGERLEARTAIEQMSELEMRNVRLENEVVSLNAEIASMEAMLRKSGGREATLEDVRTLKKELSNLRRLFDEVCKTFQRDFFVLFNERLAENDALVKQVEALQRESGEAECWRRKYSRVQKVLEEVRERCDALRNEVEAGRVEKAVAEQNARECQERADKLEALFNEREAELSQLHERLIREANAVVRLSSEIDVNKLKEHEARHEVEAARREAESARVEAEAVRAANLALQNEVKEIADKVADLRLQNSRLKEEAEALRRQNTELSDRHDEIVEVFGESIRPEPLVVQKVVSVRSVDKEALKALLWKRIVAEKCTKCIDAGRSSEGSDESVETIKLENEIKLLRLKLAQSERRNEENQRLVESMQSCIVAGRSSSKRTATEQQRQVNK